MKLILKSFLLIFILVSAASFKERNKGGVVHYKYGGRFCATVDGQKFDSRNDNKHTAELVNKTEDNMIAEPKANKVVTALTFFGNNFYDQNGNLWEERLNVEYDFNEGGLGNVSGEKISFQFRDHHFRSTADTKFKVTKLEWSKDKNSFVMSAEFDCQLLEWGTPGQSKPVVRIKGKVENISVTVPASVIKNAEPLALGELL